ncbi:hypothetical protein [Flavisericum labens]|uniref:hypothetical protein n=1 Tax=Flavisericum labens TaxID=3377112 RepID=UPI00387AD22A
MKKLLIIAMVVLFCAPLVAQEKLFIVFEMMGVDNEQESDYMETEQFWKKIHQKRVEAGDIIGWDLWALLPGGEDQGYQYVTVTLFESAEKMFGDSNLWKRVKEAYPDLSDEDLDKKMLSSAKSRDLAVRIFMEEIAGTKGDFDMKVGTIANMDFMKVDMEDYGAYEKAEMEVFQPMHQQMVDDGEKGYWGLCRFMVPTGSDTYASHLTVNMFEDIKQALSQNTSGGQPTDAQMKAIQKGLKTRDLKFTYMARLIDMAR